MQQGDIITWIKILFPVYPDETRLNNSFLRDILPRIKKRKRMS